MSAEKEKGGKTGFELAEQVLEQLPTPVMAVNRDLEIIFLNAAGRNFLGKSWDELRGKNCFDMLKSIHCNTPDCCMKKAMEDGKPHSDRNEVAPGGNKVPIEYYAAPLKDPEGNIIGGLEYVLDITERVRQQEKLLEAKAFMDSIDRSNATIEFTVDGEIINANANFLRTMDYTIDEIRSKHHRIFVDPDFAASPAYVEFWSKLKRGEYSAAEYMRLAKGGREVWLQATYNPVADADGKTSKVIKIATDITDQKLASASNAGKMAAVENSMAVVEFNIDGTVLQANNIFLECMGYQSHEIEGKHHRMFVSKEDAGNEKYAQFWTDLAKGKFQRGQFERFTKTGDSVWLEATYSPIFDPKGRVVKIVKFAYDITANVKQAEALETALGEAREAERVRKELDRAVQEMSTPVTPIWEGILLLPLVGILDSMRTSEIMNKSLSMISETRAKVFVLDISGVATVDTAVANQLIKITKATQLMGCETIISGISPAIARTIVELGVDVESIRTTAALRDAFETALTIAGEVPGGKRTPLSDSRKGKS